MTTARVAKTAEHFTKNLSSIQSGPSARALPSEIVSLRLRFTRVKGNAGLRHFVKESLASIRFANPNLKIEILPAAAVTEKSSEESSELATAKQPWEAAPGVFIGFKDGAAPEVFLELANGRSEELGRRFWQTLEDSEKLRALPTATL